MLHVFIPVNICWNVKSTALLKKYTINYTLIIICYLQTKNIFTVAVISISGNLAF
jgi:hypothetical protein